jgi:hypothetical protein
MFYIGLQNIIQVAWLHIRISSHTVKFKSLNTFSLTALEFTVTLLPPKRVNFISNIFYRQKNMHKMKSKNNKEKFNV